MPHHNYLRKWIYECYENPTHAITIQGVMVAPGIEHLKDRTRYDVIRATIKRMEASGELVKRGHAWFWAGSGND